MITIHNNIFYINTLSYNKNNNIYNTNNTIFIWTLWIIREKIIFITHNIILTHVGGHRHVQTQLGYGLGFGHGWVLQVGRRHVQPTLELGVD